MFAAADYNGSPGCVEKQDAGERRAAASCQGNVCFTWLSSKASKASVPSVSSWPAETRCRRPMSAAGCWLPLPVEGDGLSHRHCPLARLAHLGHRRQRVHRPAERLRPDTTSATPRLSSRRRWRPSRSAGRCNLTKDCKGALAHRVNFLLHSDRTRRNRLAVAEPISEDIRNLDNFSWMGLHRHFVCAYGEGNVREQPGNSPRLRSGARANTLPRSAGEILTQASSRMQAAHGVADWSWPGICISPLTDCKSHCSRALTSMRRFLSVSRDSLGGVFCKS